MTKQKTEPTLTLAGLRIRVAGCENRVLKTERALLDRLAVAEEGAENQRRDNTVQHEEIVGSVANLRKDLDALRPHATGPTGRALLFKIQEQIGAVSARVDTFKTRLNTLPDVDAVDEKHLTNYNALSRRTGVLEQRRTVMQAEIDALDNVRKTQGAYYSVLASRINDLEALCRTQSEVILQQGQRLSALEGAAKVRRPTYKRENGDETAIADMNNHHVKNAIVKILRNERNDVSAATFRDLCAEAERRQMDWRSWTPSTEPDTKYATKY